MFCGSFKGFCFFISALESAKYILRGNMHYLLICLKKDIVYRRSDNLLISTQGFGLAVPCCILWCLTSAKKYTTITFDDAKALCHIH